MINIMFKFKQYLIIGGVLLGLLGVLYVQHLNNIRLTNKLDNLEQVITINNDNQIFHRLYQDSINIAQTQTINSTIDNFKIVFKDITQDFEQSTGRNIKNLQSAFKTQVNSKEYYYIPLIDSSRKDGVLIQSFYYKDKYNTITGLLIKDSVKLDIERSMYLTKYTYSTRNKAPWYKPWKWGKHLVTDLRSDNPKDSIIKLTEINIKK